MSEYDVHAAMYDAQFGERLDDIPFYVKEAKRAEPPVLELACGTGRVLVPVAKAGVEVYGLDSSPAMLDVCRRKVAGLSARDRARTALTRADMPDFSFDERFGLIYCPFRGFLHLMTTEDQIKALRNIHTHLRGDGRFALNFFNPDVSFIAEGAERGRGAAKIQQEFTDPRSGNRVIAWATLGHDPVKQLIDTYFIHDEVDAEGRLLQRTYKPMRLRWIYRYEFEHLLYRCGFEVEALYGDFDRRPFTETHQELIWIARKA
jgi:SAM-dependent methyltransferase